MEYEGDKLLEACKICMKFNFKKETHTNKEHVCGGYDTSGCINKDRAIIVLLDKILNKMGD